jgi:hypothetical protein
MKLVIYPPCFRDLDGRKLVVQTVNSGDVAEVSMVDAMSTGILEISDLDTPNLPSNDRDIYEAVLERMLADPVESGVEAYESATPVAAASAKVEEPTNEEPAPDATAT